MSEQKIERKEKKVNDDMDKEMHEGEETHSDDMDEKQTVRKEEMKEKKGV